MDFQHLRYETEGHVRRITIDRPASRNALNARCHLELRAAFEDFRDDDDARVAILTGTGTSFCAGQDLKEVAEQGIENAGDRPFAWGGITSDFECWKPIIAAVNGYALGGGCELALACDLVVAAESASFGLPEARRGIAATAGGLVRLPRTVPVKRAMGMILTGRPVGAAEAYDIGLVNEVVPDDELVAAADRWAAEILACSPVALRTAKQVALGLLHLPVDEAMAQQDTFVRPMRSSADAAEGVRAFAEKRAPQWSGR